MSGRQSHGASRVGAISRGRRLAYFLLLVVLIAAILEGVGALAYRFGLTEAERGAVEATLGLGEREWNTVFRYRPHPYLNYVSAAEYEFEDGTRAHHATGIRDPGFPPTEKRDGVFRVVALGGSTTYGFYFEKVGSVWPHLVAMALGESLDLEVEVINAAVPNYTTFEILGMASMWLPEFQPDLVLLHTGLNDAFTVGYADEGGPDGTTFRHSWSHRPPPDSMRAAMRASRLARFLGVGYLRSGGHMAGDMAGAIQYPIPPAEQLEANIPEATGKYFRRNLETLVALVRHSGARLVLADMPLNPEYESGKGRYYDAVSAAVVRNNGIIAEVGEKYGIPVARLYEQVRDPDLFTDAAHVNQQGMIRKAQGVFEAALPVVSRMTGVSAPDFDGAGP